MPFPTQSMSLRPKPETANLQPQAMTEYGSP
jgi:hypothetical protein